MASFRIRPDQENANMGLRKETTESFAAASQRRALGDLSQFACNQNRNVKLPGLTNGPSKVQDENSILRQINNEKNIVPPVAQFRAFSVYEDKAEQNEKKRDATFKQFLAKDPKKENLNCNIENARILMKNIEKPQEHVKQKDDPVRIPLQDKRDVYAVSPMSVGVDSIVLSMSVSKNEGDTLEEEEEEGETADVTTAQTDREMFFHVVEYRQDIYEYMRDIETKHKANPRYMRKQPDITHTMRAILVDWLAEVCEEYSQQSETLHLAVSYADRFLSYMSVVRTKLQLVGTAATFIASKYEEVYPPDLGEFVYITDDTYTKREVLRMEHLMLKVLSFDLSTPTALAFLSHYCITNGLPKKIFHLAAYIAELSLLEADPYLQFKYSIIAASSLATARHCILCKRCEEEEIDIEMVLVDDSPNEECLAVAWPTQLSRSSGYDVTDLQACMRELARTHSHSMQQPHKAIPDKYRHHKLDSVSLITPRPMYPVEPIVFADNKNDSSVSRSNTEARIS